MGRFAKLALAGLFGSAAGNFVSPVAKKCLDVQAKCADDSGKDDCKRIDAADIKKTANVILYACHDDANQDWQVKEGNIINPETGLCLDVQMPCKKFADDDKTKCEEYMKVKDINDAKKDSDKHKDINVIAYTCHDKLNQKWILMNNGTIANEHLNMCLDVAAKLVDGKRQTIGEIAKEKVANVQVYECHKEVYGNQIWDLETTKDAVAALGLDAAAKKFAASYKPDFSNNKSSDLMPLAVMGVSGMAMAMVVAGVLRFRRSSSEHFDAEQALVPE